MFDNLGENRKLVLIVLITCVVGVLLGRVLPRSAAETTIKMKFGEQSLDLNVKKDMSDPQALIQKLMQQDFSKAGMLAVLGKDGIFAITDPSIIPALRALCPDRESSDHTPLQRQQRLQDCLNSTVLKQLRDLASQHDAPFQYIGREVKIATPSDREPQEGQAFVCENGGFLGHQIQITTMLGHQSITVDATGYYTCTGYSEDPDVQLSTKDAIHLFGRPTRKLEKAVAVVL